MQSNVTFTINIGHVFSKLLCKLFKVFPQHFGLVRTRIFTFKRLFKCIIGHWTTTNVFNLNIVLQPKILIKCPVSYCTRISAKKFTDLRCSRRSQCIALNVKWDVKIQKQRDTPQGRVCMRLNFQINSSLSSNFSACWYFRICQEKSDAGFAIFEATYSHEKVNVCIGYQQINVIMLWNTSWNISLMKISIQVGTEEALTFGKLKRYKTDIDLKWKEIYY